MRKLGGFTLVELLTCISIIAVLSAIILPATLKAKKRALLSQDVEQMRQVFDAVVMYEQDADDKSPTSLLYTLAYARSKQVYASPADPYAQGIPGISGFPADICAPDDPLRAPFRISYPYLYPMAIQAGFDANWYQKERNDPTYGLLAVIFYNDPYATNIGVSQFDLWRWRNTVERILTDGSLKTVHGAFGVSDECNIDSCFGLPPT